MSLQIIKAGIIDSVQDIGRYGYQHLGINPSGSMDRFASSLANALLGKDLSAPVIELHFPATKFRFDTSAVIALAGANFSPAINGQPVPMHHPVTIAAGSVLEFSHNEGGYRCYMSLLPELEIQKWLGSSSTNLKAGSGGYQGRALWTNDIIPFSNALRIDNILKGREFNVIHLTALPMELDSKTIGCILGSEWNYLSSEAKEIFNECWFEITNDSDRMGYRLKGKEMLLDKKQQMISAPATFGTIQVLPGGQLIILMADHQTTGGYPKIANVISADLPLLAQKTPGSVIRFKFYDLAEAEKKFIDQQIYLRQIQEAAGTRLGELGIRL